MKGVRNIRNTRNTRNITHYFNHSFKKKKILNNVQHSFCIDTIYNFHVKDFSFGGISREKLIEMFRDGRTCSWFCEQQLTEWFPDLVYVNKTGHDFIIRDTSQKVECKSFTKHGTKFAPPVMVGSGRSVDIEKVKVMAQELIYVFCDITKFPVINVVFKQGTQMINDFSNAQIPFNKRFLLFGY